MYNISTTTVENAYSQLYAQGYIESIPKKGYFVSDLIDIEFKSIPKISTQKQEESYLYDFSPVGHHKSYFPIKIWKRVSNRVLSKELEFNRYGDGRGDEELRVEIAKYLSSSRGVKANADNIIITSGFIDAMDIIAKLTKEDFKKFAIESPGYYIAETIFKEFGFDINKINLELDGISIDELRRSSSKLVYITPSHQYPTGKVMPITKRLKLLDYIQSVDGYLIEDDYDSELNYSIRPIPSLQGLDGSDSVIYIGTFAKVLSPAIRVAYMHLPNRLLQKYKSSYYSFFSRVSISTQKVLANFIRDGHFERHLRKMRTINKKKHNLLLESLENELKGLYKVVSKGAGLAILIYPTVKFNWQKFKELAYKKRIKLYFASLCNSSNFEAIRLGFGGFDIDDIPVAINEFAKIYKLSIDD